MMDYYNSLNLVGKAAAECCQAAISFFDFLEAIYVFSQLLHAAVQFL